MTIQKQFAYHKPSVQGLADIQKLREAFSQLDDVLRFVCPDSRERSVALTELETAAIWAVKSVVYNDPQSEVSY